MDKDTAKLRNFLETKPKNHKKMTENNEKTAKTKSETARIDGISAQINLSPGSDTHRRFAQLMRENGCATARAFVEALMDAYENQPDDLEALDELRRQTEELRTENQAYDATCQNLELDVERLKQELVLARSEADARIVIEPNPVVAHFLDEMAEKQHTTPGKILERLFLDDLQNPRANNLPYTVSSARVREVMEELKPKQP